MRISGMLAAGAVAIGLLCVNATTAFAHHSFAAEYDGNKPVTLKGTISGMQWSNPHSWVQVDSKAPDGAVKTCRCEFGSPNQLYRKGVKKTDLPVGAEVTVTGFMAKDGTTTMNATSVTLADGRQLFAGGSAPGAPPE
jgi:hypothetical protein